MQTYGIIVTPRRRRARRAMRAISTACLYIEITIRVAAGAALIFAVAAQSVAHVNVTLHP